MNNFEHTTLSKLSTLFRTWGIQTDDECSREFEEKDKKTNTILVTNKTVDFQKNINSEIVDLTVSLEKEINQNLSGLEINTDQKLYIKKLISFYNRLDESIPDLIERVNRIINVRRNYEKSIQSNSLWLFLKSAISNKSNDHLIYFINSVIQSFEEIKNSIRATVLNSAYCKGHPNRILFRDDANYPLFLSNGIEPDSISSIEKENVTLGTDLIDNISIAASDLFSDIKHIYYSFYDILIDLHTEDLDIKYTTQANYDRGHAQTNFGNYESKWKSSSFHRQVLQVENEVKETILNSNRDGNEYAYLYKLNLLINKWGKEIKESSSMLRDVAQLYGTELSEKNSSMMGPLRMKMNLDQEIKWVSNDAMFFKEPLKVSPQTPEKSAVILILSYIQANLLDVDFALQSIHRAAQTSLLLLQYSDSFDGLADVTKSDVLSVKKLDPVETESFDKEMLKQYTDIPPVKDLLEGSIKPVGFESYISVAYRDKLMPYLTQNYTNCKPKSIVPMLYALERLGIMQYRVRDCDQTDLHKALTNTFGSVGVRTGLNMALHEYYIDINKPDPNRKRQIELKKEQIEFFLNTTNLSN